MPITEKINISIILRNILTNEFLYYLKNQRFFPPKELRIVIRTKEMK